MDNNIEELLNEAKEAFNNGEHKKAIEYLDKVIFYNGDSFSLYHNRGLSKLELCLYEEAVKDFDIVINKNPNHFNAYYYRGSCKRYLKNYDEAIKDIDKAIDIIPDNAEFYSERASSYEYLNKYKESIEDYSKAIELKNNDWFLYILRAKEKCFLSIETKTEDKKSFFGKIVSKISSSRNYSDLEKSALDDLEKSYQLALEDEFYIMVFQDIIKEEFIDKGIHLVIPFCKERNILD